MITNNIVFVKSHKVSGAAMSQVIMRSKCLRNCLIGFFTSIFVFTLARILVSENNDVFIYGDSQMRRHKLEGLIVNCDKLTVLKRQYFLDSCNGDTVPSKHFLVPNIIHYIRWNKPEYSFNDYVCFRSAYLVQKPDFFYIHTNKNFSGKYWSIIKEELEWIKKIKIFWLEPPTSIFGQKMRQGYSVHHGSDFERINAVIKYGGIYLDNDMYVVQNLNFFRRFEMTIGWDENRPLTNGIFLANKNAKFLRLWIGAYKRYYPDRWYYNSGELPTYRILYTNPSLVHRVKTKFGGFIPSSFIYNQYMKNWTEYFTIHILDRHRHYLDKENVAKFGDYNEKRISECNCTFTAMAMMVLPETLLNHAHQLV